MIQYDETKTYTPGTIVLYKGQQHKVCKNQSLYNLEKKRITATKQTTTKFTPETRHAITAARREAAQAAAQAGLSRMARPGTADPIMGAWSDIIESQARLAINTQRGRSSTIAAQFVGKAAGFFDINNEQNPQIVQNQAIIMSDQLAQAILTRVSDQFQAVDNSSYQQQEDQYPGTILDGIATDADTGSQGIGAGAAGAGEQGQE